MTLEDKKCHCNEIAFTYLNCSTGQRVYRCDRSKNFWNEETKELCPTKENLPCNYEEIVQLYNPTFAPRVIEKKNCEEITPIDNKKELQRLVGYFLNSKYWSTFQEIEIICKTLNIKPYNHKEETIYEFTQRILHESELL